MITMTYTLRNILPLHETHEEGSHTHVMVM